MVDVDTERTLELLWGTGQRPRRGPKPALSVAKLAEVAIGIADAEGLDAVSMQRVAGALGYTTMSLYRYVPAKEQLIEVMADRAAGAPPEPGTGDWRSEVERWVREMWAIYAAHPWLLHVKLSGPPMGPGQLAWFDAGLRALSGSGLPGDEMVMAFLFLNGAVRELARVIGDIARARQRAGVTDAQAEAGYAKVLRDHADAERFPTLARVVAEGVFDPAPAEGMIPDLEFGLRRLMDGLQAYARSRG
ncbi:MAG TPA: TetR/AcrR family transcriptional regulator C-terminal domain-containing protein [Amycolatopsis sp.]|nr:TetR/AcrR family transcriptional regulator C-terminal domain-containing protein [Amycolatopsis sp.]